MQTNRILSASLEDIIFDGRNKEYGAYYLRTTYPRRIKKALLVTTSIGVLIFGGAVLAGSLKKNEEQYKIIPDVHLTEVDTKKPPEKLPEPEKQPRQPEEVKTVKLTPPVITPDEEMKTPPPSQDDLTVAKIGEIKTDGKDDDGISTPPVISEGTGKGIIEPKNDQPDEPFTTVEIDAKFNGNWKAFLEKNLNPDTPSDYGAPAGRYSVAMQFVVDLEGNVSDIKALTAHGYGMEAEALRVLRKAARWEPAIQNGIKVKAYRKQVITFEVLDSE